MEKTIDMQTNISPRLVSTGPQSRPGSDQDPVSLEILRAGRSKPCRQSAEIRGYLALVGAESSQAPAQAVKCRNTNSAGRLVLHTTGQWGNGINGINGLDAYISVCVSLSVF